MPRPRKAEGSIHSSALVKHWRLTARKVRSLMVTALHMREYAKKRWKNTFTITSDRKFRWWLAWDEILTSSDPSATQKWQVVNSCTQGLFLKHSFSGFYWLSSRWQVSETLGIDYVLGIRGTQKCKFVETEVESWPRSHMLVYVCTLSYSCTTQLYFAWPRSSLGMSEAWDVSLIFIHSDEAAKRCCSVH